MHRDAPPRSPEEPAAEIETKEEPGISLEEYFADAAREAPAPRPSPVPTLRTAQLCNLDGDGCTLTFRGKAARVSAVVAPEVSRELIVQALRQGDSVLVEQLPNEAPVVVGVLQTHLPQDVHLKGATVTIEAEQEILLRAGRSALRLRDDGDVELVGSRISAASRGLFRLVGRMLRLN